MNEDSDIRALPHYREPVVGADVCVPSSLYLSHGEDDFQGGMCEISGIEEGPGGLMVTVRERPGYSYGWANLMREEADSIERYGDQRGHADPDTRPEMNSG